MPKRPDFLERLSKDDPNYEIGKRFYLEAWRDSHRLVADAHAGSASLSDFIEGCVNGFAQGAEIHVALKDSTSIAGKCDEMDSMAKRSIRMVSRSLSPHSERLGEADVKAAVDEFSRRVNEIAARSKQRMFEAELAVSANSNGGNRMNLTSLQKGLLMAIVDRHLSNNGAPYMFAQSHSGNGLGSNGPPVPPNTDVSDFLQLQREGFLTVETVGPNVIRGKPTQLGIDTLGSVRSNQPGQTNDAPHDSQGSGPAQKDDASAAYSESGQLIPEAFKEDASARPLGENPFPLEHPPYEAFEEATWKAKEAINDLRSDLLETLSKPQFDFIQAILTYRVRGFSAYAHAALSIVGNEATGAWYEHWLDDYARFLLSDTLQKGQLKDPKAEPGSQPLFTPQLLPRITVDLHIQLMHVVAQCKKEAANRVLQAMQMRKDRLADQEEKLPEESLADMKSSDQQPNGVVPPEPAIPEVVAVPANRNLEILRGADGKLKRVVTVAEACRYGGVGQRAIQKACRKGSLESEGEGPNRRIIVQSLMNYYPPENNAN